MFPLSPWTQGHCGPVFLAPKNNSAPSFCVTGTHSEITPTRPLWQCLPPPHPADQIVSLAAPAGSAPGGIDEVSIPFRRYGLDSNQPWRAGCRQQRQIGGKDALGFYVASSSNFHGKTSPTRRSLEFASGRVCMTFSCRLRCTVLRLFVFRSLYSLSLSSLSLFCLSSRALSLFCVSSRSPFFPLFLSSLFSLFSLLSLFILSLSFLLSLLPLSLSLSLSLSISLLSLQCLFRSLTRACTNTPVTLFYTHTHTHTNCLLLSVCLCLFVFPLLHPFPFCTILSHIFPRRTVSSSP